MKDFTTFLTYSGINTILFLILLLSMAWKKREANKILASTLVSFLLLFVAYAFLYLEQELFTSIITPTGIIIPSVLRPLIFYYIKTIYTSTIDFKEFTRSLIPFGVAFVFIASLNTS